MSSSVKGRGALPEAAAVRSRAASAAKEAATTSLLPLYGMLFVGFVLRLLFMPGQGFKNDVSSFESWALTIAQHPLRDFYATAGFADYPPGYFFVLWFVGHAYAALVHADPTWSALKFFVKLPAVVADLACGAFLFAIVRRCTASRAWAYGAAALFLFNPAVIFISAYWGQVDSVAAAILLGSIACIVMAEDAPVTRVPALTTAAWALLGCTILIKPPAAVLIPLLLAYGLLTGAGAVRRARALGSVLGILASLTLAYLSAFVFHAGWNPIDQFAWLYQRYHYASGVYQYNSVNAFNVYAVLKPFWQPDTVAVFGGLPQYDVGIAALLVATGFIVWRYLRAPGNRSFLEAAALLSLAFFALSTRMHERYVFNGLIFCIALIFAGRRYRIASIALSCTLFVNLLYSLFYLNVVNDHLPGYNPTDLVPWVTHPMAAFNTALFLGLTFAYVDPEAMEWVRGWSDVTLPAVRAWFAPREGMARESRLDALLAVLFTCASFGLTALYFWLPTEKIFDEIYYARAAEEYIRHVEIYEFTHPPLTKLIITASTLMFGDNSFGWRLLNLVVGALMVGVLYLFAKRLLGSTVFAAIAAGLLLFDGFHFVQSRIATPEITVAFFSLTTLYAFYRFWLASSVRVAPRLSRRTGMRGLPWFALGTLIAAAIASATVVSQATPQQALSVWIVVFLYCESAVYLLVRFLVARFAAEPSQVSYADGTRVSEGEVRTLDGGALDEQRRIATPGDCSKVRNGALELELDELRASYEASGAVRYRTPEGEARFSPDGTMAVEGAVLHAKEARRWMGLLALSSALLAASKWNGLFDFFVVWVIAAWVVAQPFLPPLLNALGVPAKRRPAAWGNPFGISFDVLVAAMLLVGATIYVLTYIPYFTLHHTLGDLLGLQVQMFTYHYDLHATHPYSSKWWQWPLLEIPISYYYKDLRVGAALNDPHACCVAEILALPNPVVWWTGLVSVPLMAWWGWRERNKGYLLLIVAYFLQWLPWILSPRIAFEYHFFPNLAIIVLADAVLLQRVWRKWGRWPVGVYLACTLAAFVFWYPVLAGTPLPWYAWDARMLTPLEHNNWINPHPGR